MSKYTLDFAFIAGAEDMHIHSERMGGILRRMHFYVGVRVVRIHEKSDGNSLGQKLML